jgi:hypothetical protein
MFFIPLNSILVFGKGNKAVIEMSIVVFVKDIDNIVHSNEKHKNLL